jgi:hypothetical protein
LIRRDVTAPSNVQQITVFIEGMVIELQRDAAGGGDCGKLRSV